MDGIETGRQRVQVALSRDELQLVRTALALLEDTLGREEADELREVQELKRRLDDASGRGTTPTT